MRYLRSLVFGLIGAGTIVSGLVLGQVSAAQAGLIHGTVNLAGVGGFDFSDQKTYPGPPTDYPVDILSAIVVDPPLGLRLVAWRGYILAVPDSLVEDITIAPVDASVYRLDEPPVYNRAYVFKTDDGYYAKFAFRSELVGDWTIEYWVQMNGSNVLTDPSPTRPTTWGRVKALYRN